MRFFLPNTFSGKKFFQIFPIVVPWIFLSLRYWADLGRSRLVPSCRTSEFLRRQMTKPDSEIRHLFYLVDSKLRLTETEWLQTVDKGCLWRCTWGQQHSSDWKRFSVVVCNLVSGLYSFQSFQFDKEAHSYRQLGLQEELTKRIFPANYLGYLHIWVGAIVDKSSKLHSPAGLILAKMPTGEVRTGLACRFSNVLRIW